DKKINKEVLRTLMRETYNQKINMYTYIVGDFNAVGSTIMDTNNSSRKNQGLGKTLIEWLRNRDFMDTFRYINPHKKEYTWQKENLANISDINMLIGSDHKLVWAEVETDAILHYIDHQEESSYITRQQKKIGSYIATKINKEWEFISSAILKAAMKHIPWINIKKTETQARISVPKHKIYREIKFLYQLQKKNRMHNGNEISLCDQSKFNTQIDS
ncbi:32951_t:CDS:2, partial [Gigaspora margarita]